MATNHTVTPGERRKEKRGHTMIPDHLPLLRKGSGDHPEDGGCLVEISSYLHDGRSWDDHTPCVHPVLRSLAISVNDVVSDEYRPQLAPLAADLVGTGPEPTDPAEAKLLNVRLAVWACDRVHHLMDPDSQAAVAAARTWVDCPCEPHGAAARAAAGAAAGAAAEVGAGAAAGVAAEAAAWVAAGVGAGAAAEAAAGDAALHRFLADAISEHQHLTGGSRACPVDTARWAAVCDLIGSETASPQSDAAGERGRL